MILHVLPGDAQVEEFRKTSIDGEIVICREALVDGDVRAESLEELWKVRERYLAGSYPESQISYRERVASEFEKLVDLTASTEVNLWFEYELFCHVNLWFCVWLLRDTPAELYRIAPITQEKERVWEGFSGLGSEDLKLCYEERLSLSRDDIQLGAELWTAFQRRDYDRLAELGESESACFPYLKEAIEAEITKETLPREVLRKLRDEGVKDFDEMFAGFRRRAGIYGFGDSQVRRLLNEI